MHLGPQEIGIIVALAVVLVAAIWVRNRVKNRLDKTGASSKQ